MTEALLQLAAGLGFPRAAGTIVSGDSFISSKEQKARILSAFPHAVACEMEGGSIGHTCYLMNTPFLVLRSISDNADDAAKIDFPKFAQDSARQYAALIENALPKLCAAF